MSDIQDEKKNANLIDAIEQRPVGPDALSQVHQVSPRELYSSKGGNELLDSTQHISRWNCRYHTT